MLLEVEVSNTIQAMPLLFVAIDDPSGPESIVECDSIALLSNFQREPIDPPSTSWLGLNSYESKVRGSGLWNIDHVEEEFTEGFLTEFRHRVDVM
jgi:hypothetical protein